MKSYREKKAVVLLSGGLDSTTTLYWVKNKGYKCHCLIFDYGQRHRREINSAIRIARKTNCKYELIKFRLPWGGSALLDKKLELPKNRTQILRSKEIPSTYVPARNTIFLSFALSYAETINAKAIFIGANCLDYSGYPDCRPEYYTAFCKVAEKGTKLGVTKPNSVIKIYTPLIKKTKTEIIRLGQKLGVPFELTWSCYEGGREPCGQCDSCFFRAKGFLEAGLIDPLCSVPG